ncbi:MAG: endolytic transglycosylase MltG [Acidimicrobiales bacterium]|nr:endolytic transglycosylase MltG [Acidimicrobiales bacterium]
MTDGDGPMVEVPAVPSPGPTDAVPPAGPPVEPGGRGPLRRHPWRTVAVAVIVGGIALVLAVYLWVRSEANPSGPLGPQVVVTVAPGASVGGVIDTLAADKVVGSSLAYRIWSQFNSLPGLQSGSYAFNQNSSFDRVRRVLAAGPNVFSVDVPAGFTVREVAARVGQVPGHSSAAFLSLAQSGTVHSPWQPVGVTSLEGLLGTGSYRVLPGESEQDVLVAMVDRFDQEADAQNLTAGAAALGYTPYQVITVASIVEKEGVIKKNLGPVARVIYNRLADGTPLQMDSTVLYALGRDGGPVTSADLATKTPYNSYLHAGLTPTPICFPSPDALAAALHPPPGSWRYFVVVQADGTEAFSDTFAEQQANEALARQRGLP